MSIEKTLTNKIENGGPGEGRGSKDDEKERREFDVHRVERVGKNVQASPNLRNAWVNTQVADHFRRRRSHSLTMEEAGNRRSASEESHGSARLVTKEEDNYYGVGQIHHATLWSRCPAGVRHTWRCGEGAEQGDSIRERQR